MPALRTPGTPGARLSRRSIAIASVALVAITIPTLVVGANAVGRGPSQGIRIDEEQISHVRHHAAVQERNRGLVPQAFNIEGTA